MRCSLKGPRQPKAPVHRRPLPSDPITGVPPPIHDHEDSRVCPSRHTAHSEHVHTPPRSCQTPNYIPNQSPLQNVEYGIPSHRFSRSQSNGADAFAISSTAQPLSNDRYDSHDFSDGGVYPRREEWNPYGAEHQQKASDDQNNPRQAPVEIPHPAGYGSSPSPEGLPPPPPVHRSRNNSQHVSTPPPTSSQRGYGFPSNSEVPSQSRTPPHETHRHSVPTYSQGNSYQPYSPVQLDSQLGRSANGYQKSSAGHHSYDSGYNADYGSMQPTVEDAPPTPSPASYSGHRSRGQSMPHDERMDPSPAPLNFIGRENAIFGRNSASSTPSHVLRNDSLAYGLSKCPVSLPLQSGTSFSSRTSYNSAPRNGQPQRRNSEDTVSGSVGGYGPPMVPPTLVAGMDPIIAKEVSDSIYQEKRASTNPSSGNSPWNRHDSPQYYANRPHNLSYHVSAAAPSAPAAVTHDERQSGCAKAATAISPDPRVPNRKSVSPAPGLPEGRRLSGVPFGPDSYNALNPSLAGSKSTPSLSANYYRSEVDPDAKIITHDGREIDPSDHIPESNYAPLLEKNGPKYASQIPDRNYRQPPSSAQSSPASGPRPLRQPGRPQSMAASSPISMTGSTVDPSTPQTGRNRLQKKPNRMSAQPAPHSSPLAPISPFQENSFTPKSLPRGSTGDHSNENYPFPNYGSSPVYRGTSGPPPVPAKIPMGMNGPPPPPPGVDAWALLEEMKNIDLGSGRARRRGH